MQAGDPRSRPGIPEGRPRPSESGQHRPNGCCVARRTCTCWAPESRRPPRQGARTARRYPAPNAKAPAPNAKVPGPTRRPRAGGQRSPSPPGSLAPLVTSPVTHLHDHGYPPAPSAILRASVIDPRVQSRPARATFRDHDPSASAWVQGAVGAARPDLTWGEGSYACRGSGGCWPARLEARCEPSRRSQVKSGAACCDDRLNPPRHMSG
jgi:hypothetical protein